MQFAQDVAYFAKKMLYCMSSKEDAFYGLLDRRLMGYETQNTTETQTLKVGITLDLPWFFEFWRTQKDLLDALERSGVSGILVQRGIHNSQRAEIFLTMHPPITPKRRWR